MLEVQYVPQSRSTAAVQGCEHVVDLGDRHYLDVGIDLVLITEVNHVLSLLDASYAA